MHLDVVDLKRFYYQTKLGRVAQRAIRHRVLQLWPAAEMSGQSVMGFGFSVPLLRPYLETARLTVGLMPGQQGVMPWPAHLPNHSVLCEETYWPLQAGSADRLMLMHGLETSEHPTALLHECYRVLAPEGRALFIVPNRSGIWARRDITPFGFGRPYSLGQLEGQVKQVGFTPERHATALYSPPSEKAFWLKLSNWLERTGTKLPFIAAGGVILLEVTKQTYAPTRPGLAERLKQPLRVLEPALPEPKPTGRDVQMVAGSDVKGG